MNEQMQAIINATTDVSVSLNKACEILHRGKRKVKGLVGTRIRQIDSKHTGCYELRLSDVLSLIGKNI